MSGGALVRRYLITVIPQIGGGVREISSTSEADARCARIDLRDDPANIEALRSWYSTIVIRDMPSPEPWDACDGDGVRS